MVSTLHRGGHRGWVSTGWLRHVLWRLCCSLHLRLSVNVLATALRWIRHWVIGRHVLWLLCPAVLGVCRVNSCILHSSLSLYLLTTTRCRCAQNKFWIIRRQEFWLIETDNRKVEIMEVKTSHVSKFYPVLTLHVGMTVCFMSGLRHLAIGAALRPYWLWLGGLLITI